MVIKLGSLFDGIGGFPLAGVKFGFVPVWASEIEPWPIKVTEKHFPGIKHLGDITQINGGEIEPVDIITFGSPCQDLSIAGKREGLAGERSGLFMDAIRIIRQMRTATGGKCPRFAVWENVPGAFSSNKGEDFRAVLEEITEAEIPMPRSGKWATAGMVRTERVDVAWRVLDAQYWGVPQRRRRIFLVADFGGQCAGEILFVKEGLSGDFAESGKAREEAAATVGGGVKGTDYLTGWDCQEKRIFSDKGVAPTISGSDGGGGRTGVGYVATVRGECLMFENHGQDTRFKGPLDIAQPVTATFGMGGNNQPFVVHKSSYWDGGQISDCLDCSMLAKGQMMPEKRGFPVVIEPRSQDGVPRIHSDGVVPTLNTSQGGQRQPCVLIGYQESPNIAHCIQGSMIGRKDKNGPQGDGINEDLSFTLNTTDRHAVAYGMGSFANYNEGQISTLKANGGDLGGGSKTLVRQGYAVRRLTPLECLRLQGFPDWWLDIEGMSDTQKYKAVGNSVAIPCVKFVLGGIARAMRPEG